MTTVVVPFRAGKRRLGLPEQERAAAALAMLEAVLAAATAVGRAILVTDDAKARSLAARMGVQVLADPGGGQGAAVAAGLRAVRSTPALVVNADLPLATPDDLARLAEAAPALVAARDGTTNALALMDPAVFRPLYGPGSARRFAALGLRRVELPNLAEDVDTAADLERIRLVTEARA
jgi:2-phospho-L-lactate guanylyltransferase